MNRRDSFAFTLPSELMIRSRRYSYLVIAGLFVLSAVSGVRPQSSTSPALIDFPPTEYDGVYMHMLLEKTLLKVDVLTLEVWLGGEEVRRIKELVAEGVRSREVEDAIADAATHSQDAYVRFLFVRDNISLEQFVDGAREDLGRVSKAGIVSKEHVEQVVAIRTCARTTAADLNSVSVVQQFDHEVVVDLVGVERNDTKPIFDLVRQNMDAGYLAKRRQRDLDQVVLPCQHLISPDLFFQPDAQ